MRKTLLALLPLLFFLTSCDTDPNTYALIETDMGNIKVMLYPETPRHTENFVKLANEGYFDGTLFHRIISNFMIQGGDPDSKTAGPGQRLGGGGPGYTIPHEIGAPHIAGALAAARTNNPEKASSGSQFYIVTGIQQVDSALDQIERRKNFKYNETQRQLYKEKGGRPDLDGEYTVFGEVIEGMDVVMKIATAEKDPADRPVQDISMKVSIVD
ncbi:peptidylprolyl isomerase [Lewinellaceae bacterium SD302]|nr:peptidylprolyl isomerase [Lewinellaceae bacterium SD302]